MTHIDEAAVREQAVDIGSGYRIAGLVLDRADTAWNPASTKGPLFGPGLVEYVLHRSGIQMYEFDQLEGCLYSSSCASTRVSGTTRCAEHALKNFELNG